jgi:hypothetical protein
LLAVFQSITNETDVHALRSTSQAINAHFQQHKLVVFSSFLVQKFDLTPGLLQDAVAIMNSPSRELVHDENLATMQ